MFNEICGQQNIKDTRSVCHSDPKDYLKVTRRPSNVVEMTSCLAWVLARDSRNEHDSDHSTEMGIDVAQYDFSKLREAARDAEDLIHLPLHCSEPALSSPLSWSQTTGQPSCKGLVVLGAVRFIIVPVNPRIRFRLLRLLRNLSLSLLRGRSFAGSS